MRLADQVLEAILQGPYGRYKIEKEVMYHDLLSSYKGRERADFVITKLKLVIEVDGQQHFYPVAFDGDVPQAIQNFKRQRRRDDCIRESLKDSNYTLLSLSYKEIMDNQKHLTNYVGEKITQAILDT